MINVEIDVYGESESSLKTIYCWIHYFKHNGTDEGGSCSGFQIEVSSEENSWYCDRWLLL